MSSFVNSNFYGKIKVVDNCKYISCHLKNNKDVIWEKHIYNKFKEYLKKDDVVLDIGAHIGLHSLAINNLDLDIKIHAFECVPKLFQLLKYNTKKHKNIKIYNKIVSFHNKNLFYVYDDDLNNMVNSGGYCIKKNLENNYTPVECVTIDSLNFKKVDLIKLDVEGFEYDVLLGMKDSLLNNKPILFIEIFENHFKKVNDFLNMLNYYKKEKLDSINYIYTFKN